MNYRIGVIIRVDKSTLVTVRYVNPTDSNDARVIPIKKLNK